jgi:sugar phosphate isomerase/epimerase
MPGRLNDGSQDAPRLRPTHALWALIGLPRGGTEWTMDEKFRRVKEAGFEAVECWPDAETAGEIRKTLDKHGLRLGYGARGGDIATIRAKVCHAKDMDADYVNCHMESPYMTDDQIETLARDILKLSDDENIPIFIETHRGTATENLFRVWELIRRVPEIRFTADISHFAVGSETTAMTDEYLAPVLERVSSFHARVSNGQQIQVDVGQGDTEPARQFAGFWTTAMRHWKKDARPGDILPFVSELGPPTYGIVDAEGNETSDRWEQSLVLRRLGEQAWANA